MNTRRYYLLLALVIALLMACSTSPETRTEATAPSEIPQEPSSSQEVRLSKPRRMKAVLLLRKYFWKPCRK